MTEDELDDKTTGFIEGMMKNASEFAGKQADATEDRRVAALLTAFGYGRAVQQFRRERQNTADLSQLDCLWFAGKFPDCPVLFATASVSAAIARRRMPKDWFFNFEKMPMLPAFDLARQLYQDMDMDKPVGLIFSWPGWHTPLLLHNWQHRRSAESGYWAYYRKQAKMRVYMEPLDQVLEQIKARWNPAL